MHRLFPVFIWTALKEKQNNQIKTKNVWVKPVNCGALAMQIKNVPPACYTKKPSNHSPNTLNTLKQNNSNHKTNKTQTLTLNIHSNNTDE